MTKPAAKIRDKNLTLTIWENKSENDTSYYSSNLSKSYKDDANEWQETTNLSTDDLLRASNLLQLGYNKISEMK